MKISLLETRRLKHFAIGVIAALFAHGVFANPVLNNVEAGNVSVSTSGNTLQVNQSTNQAVINWKSFNINSNETTQFQQPSSSSIALNRIDPTQGASDIYGHLTANGQIILVNQAGIHFHSGAVVDVSGLVASTIDISTQNFLAGKYIFDGTGNTPASIINEGTLIAANHGLIALIGSTVDNRGDIQANLGNIILASGNKATLNFSSDGLISFAVDEASLGKVANSGTLTANGGKILLTAAQAEGVMDDAINMSGVAIANSVAENSGEIILSAGDGSIDVSGQLIASGDAAGQMGGTVKVLGANIHLQSPALIDVSGDAGGGTILVGGNFHGTGPEPNALTTLVDSGVILNANALTNGNGGNVAVWSDLNTGFHGNVFAEGGALGGDGGFVETSAHGPLDISGAFVNTLAPLGNTGTWLLDPFNVTISTAATTGTTGTYVANASGANINTTDLATALNSSNVNITTGSSGNESGDITVSNAITTSNSAATSLTLTAANNIILNAPISLTSTSGGSGAANLTLTAGGNITLNSNITLTDTNRVVPLVNGTLTMNATSGRIGDSSSTALTITASDMTLTANNISFTGTEGATSAAGKTTFNNTFHGYGVNFVGTGTGGGTITLKGVTVNTSTDASQTGGSQFTTGTGGSITLGGTGSFASVNLANYLANNFATSMALTTSNFTVGPAGFSISEQNGSGNRFGTRNFNLLSGASTTLNGPITMYDATLTSSTTVYSIINPTSTVNVTTPGLIAQGQLFQLSGGTLNINAGTYNEALTVSVPTILTSSGGTVTVNSLTANNTLSGFSGTWAAASSGNFTFNNPVVLTGNASLSTAGAITFGSTVNGGYGLTTSASGATTFSGILGGSTALASLTTGGSGSDVINTTGITTSGNQTYNNAISLGASPTFTMNSGTMTFGNSLAGNGNTLSLAGGSGSNTFAFQGSASNVTETITGGSSGTQQINYGSYSSPVNIALSSSTAGTVRDNSNNLLSTFSNINSIVGNSSSLNSTSLLTLPNQTNTVNVNGYGQGALGSSLVYSGILRIALQGTSNLVFNVAATSSSTAGIYYINGSSSSAIQFDGTINSTSGLLANSSSNNSAVISASVQASTVDPSASSGTTSSTSLPQMTSVSGNIENISSAQQTLQNNQAAGQKISSCL